MTDAVGMGRTDQSEALLDLVARTQMNVKLLLLGDHVCLLVADVCLVKQVLMRPSVHQTSVHVSVLAHISLMLVVSFSSEAAE